MYRCKANPEQTDPYTRGKIQSLWEAVKEEISQVKGYERKLQELNRTVYSSKAPSSNNNQWTPREVVQRQPHREPPSVDNSQWPPREAPQPPARRQAVPSRAPVKPPVPRAQRQPDVKGAAPKVNSGRGKGNGKQKAQQQDAEPWESWEGQDKELAGNLANDIMDSSPGIRWDDIAGLQDAKRILQACSQLSTALMLARVVCVSTGHSFVCACRKQWFFPCSNQSYLLAFVNLSKACCCLGHQGLARHCSQRLLPQNARPHSLRCHLLLSHPSGAENPSVW